MEQHRDRSPRTRGPDVPTTRTSPDTGHLDTLGVRHLTVDTLEALRSATAHDLPGVAVAQLDGRAAGEVNAPDTVVRPRFVQWVADAAQGADGLLARQSQRQRRVSRIALRAAAPLSFDICPLSGPTLAEWSALYASQHRRHALDLGLVGFYTRAVALESTDDMLLVWRSGATMVGGCIVNVDSAQGALRGRFCAVRDDYRDRELTRAMYLASADVARDCGLPTVTLGADPNFFGAAIPWGLAPFKLRLGFTPVPNRVLSARRAGDVTERVVSMAGLAGPLLRFAYPEATPEPDAAYLDGDAELCLVADCTPDDVAARRDVKARYLTVHDGSPALVRTQGDEASRSG